MNLANLLKKQSKNYVTRRRTEFIKPFGFYKSSHLGRSTIKMKCIECEEDILEDTAFRTGSKCMPCYKREEVQLVSKDDQEKFNRIKNQLKKIEWDVFCPHKRKWLELQEKIKREILRENHDLIKILSSKSLSNDECKTRSKIRWKIRELRIMSHWVFNPEILEANRKYVIFSFEGAQHKIDLTVPRTERRMHFLNVVNKSLENAQVSQRFILVKDKDNQDVLMFTSPRVIEKLKEIVEQKS